MTEYVSGVKRIYHNDNDVYRVLSDPRKLGQLKGVIPEDSVRSLTFDEESVSFHVDKVGVVRFQVIEREPNKLVKLKSEKLPFDVFLWIQLVPKGDKDTRLRLTLRANLNPLMKGMVDKPLKEMLEKIANALSVLPYDHIS